MSKRTLAQLVSEMQGTSRTHGWDALTLYDQRKANELLHQLFVGRFNSESYIEPVTMISKWGDGEYKEHISNVRLGPPLLSFEISNPAEAARARLTMDMIGGTIVTTRKGSSDVAYVTKMLQILPVGGPKLWMTQPITKGTVGVGGEVQIDIRNANEFKANFVFGSLAEEEVGRRFQEYFETEIRPEQKVFPLGRLDPHQNGLLTPKNFEIRVMKSDPTARLGDLRYGDGAIMMFITLQGGTDGLSFPSERDLYLIPIDGNNARYTGTMLLSSRVLFDKFFVSRRRMRLAVG